MSKPTFVFWHTLVCAKGADTRWKEAAERAGHRVETVGPDDSDLDDWKEATAKVNASIKRTFPTGKPFVNRLLMRNVKAAAAVDSVYAVGHLDPSVAGLVCGGTAWACGHMVNRIRAEPGPGPGNLALWFFDRRRTSPDSCRVQTPRRRRSPASARDRIPGSPAGRGRRD